MYEVLIVLYVDPANTDDQLSREFKVPFLPPLKSILFLSETSTLATVEEIITTLNTGIPTSYEIRANVDRNSFTQQERTILIEDEGWKVN